MNTIDQERLNKLKVTIWSLVAKNLLNNKIDPYEIKESDIENHRGRISKALRLLGNYVSFLGTKKIKDSNAKKALSALTVNEKETVKIEKIQDNIVVPEVIENVDLETGEVLQFDDGKHKDIEKLEQMVSENKISLDIMIDNFKESKVDCITDLEHSTIKTLINKYS